MYCGFLLDRIPHAALVLDRFGAALRPGGLLLLRIRDRNCAAAALDRRTPEPLRRILWARLHAGQPGPFPAIYDPVSSARGMQAYASAHGLVIIRRETARTATGPPGRLSGTVDAARALIAWLSRGGSPTTTTNCCTSSASRKTSSPGWSDLPRAGRRAVPPRRIGACRARAGRRR